MICFAFTKMADVSTLIDRQRFRVIEICDDGDLAKIDQRFKIADDRKILILIAGIERLKSYYNDSQIALAKILLFDSPHNFFIEKLEFSDAIPRTDGTWSKRSLEPLLVLGWIERMNFGKSLDEMTVTWSMTRSERNEHPMAGDT